MHQSICSLPLAVLATAGLLLLGCGGGDGDKCVDADGDGFGRNCEAGPDCDDGDRDVNPDAAEVCDNGIDDDCDDETDEGCATGCVDADGDGYDAQSPDCASGDDCDDADADVNPGADEVCDNGIDDDCDGETDEGCGTDCVDEDGDGYDAESQDCPTGDDCDDGNAAINPGAEEVCNQVDDDCDDEVDEGGVCPQCTDGDGDGYGPGCAAGPDCDDEDPDINPDAIEACDGVDNDCDDEVDEDGVCGDCVDADGDGHNADSQSCIGGDDCDDSDPAVNPEATENPRNNIDDDCDDEVDEAIASPYQGDLVFNEVLLDGNTNADANGDGDIDATDDEFVEIVNVSDAAVDLAGWSLWDSDQPNPRHTFPAGFELPAGEAVVVFGGGGVPDDSTGVQFLAAENTDPGMNFGLSLNNGGDVLTLYDDQMREVLVFGYGDEGIIAAVQDESITRDPDISGDFTAHTDAAGDPDALFSPGTKIDGTSFP